MSTLATTTSATSTAPPAFHGNTGAWLSVSAVTSAAAGAATASSSDVRGRSGLHAIAPRDLARRRAVLLQENTVSFPFPVRQVVQMGRAPWARTPAENADDQIVDDAMIETEVLGLSGRTVSSLSGGERARVALARVLAQATPILLLDEPTAALDLKHHEDVMRLVRRQADAGAAIAVVLHDLNAALAHADRVSLLSAGRVVATGAPEEVLTAARIEEVYGQAVDVFPHPSTGVPIIVARR